MTRYAFGYDGTRDGNPVVVSIDDDGTPTIVYPPIPTTDYDAIARRVKALYRSSMTNTDDLAANGAAERNRRESGWLARLTTTQRRLIIRVLAVTNCIHVLWAAFCVVVLGSGPGSLLLPAGFVIINTVIAVAVKRPAPHRWTWYFQRDIR